MSKIKKKTLSPAVLANYYLLTSMLHSACAACNCNKITNLPSLPLTTNHKASLTSSQKQNHNPSLTSSPNKITIILSLPLTTKSQSFPHFLSQLNLCPIISLHNTLSNFCLFPQFLSDNLFNPHNLLPTVPSLKENDIKTALSLSRSNLI